MDPYIVASNLKILIPVGTALIIVANVKYPRVSTPNIWCACTTNPSTPVAGMKYFSQVSECFFFFILTDEMRSYQILAV
jgi:hypothetical protein